MKEIRGRGLLVRIELNVPARPYCERLAELGILCKGAHDKVLRIAPPLVIKKAELEWAARAIAPGVPGLAAILVTLEPLSRGAASDQ